LAHRRYHHAIALSPPQESLSSDPALSPAESPRPARRLDVRRLPDHRERLFRAAYALCRSRDDAEDLVQQTFVRVLQRPRFLRRDDDLAYLMRVLRNTWINTYKQRARRPQTVELDESTEFIVDHGADPQASADAVREIYAAVGRLSPPLRETIVAVDVLGLSYRQAARALRVRPGTVMSRLHRARGEVAAQLERAGLGPSAGRSA
jgi:RNA polymerase sigma-70 factor (ECF subfamily)